MDTTLIQSVQDKYRVLDAILDERGRRVWAAAEARSLRRGGVSLSPPMNFGPTQHR